MKKILIFVLLALLAAATVAGCGTRMIRRNDYPADWFDAATKSAAKPTAKPEQKAVEYPGKLAYELAWTEEVDDGFELDLRVQIWDPVELDKDYLHREYVKIPDRNKR